MKISAVVVETYFGGTPKLTLNNESSPTMQIERSGHTTIFTYGHDWIDLEHVYAHTKWFEPIKDSAV